MVALDEIVAGRRSGSLCWDENKVSFKLNTGVLFFPFLTLAQTLYRKESH